MMASAMNHVRQDRTDYDGKGKDWINHKDVECSNHDGVGAEWIMMVLTILIMKVQIENQSCWCRWDQ